MSRTVHHVTYKQRDSTKAKNDGRRPWWRGRFWPVEEHAIPSALRYSSAVVAAANESGHRPRPQPINRRLRAGTYPRTAGLRIIGCLANRQERALRAEDRSADRKARQVLRGSQDAIEAAWEVDFPEPRHRHFAVWDSW